MTQPLNRHRPPLLPLDDVATLSDAHLGHQGGIWEEETGEGGSDLGEEGVNERKTVEAWEHGIRHKSREKKMIQPFTGLKTKLLAISLALPESRTCVPSISIWPQRNVPDIASVILPSLESHPGLIVNSTWRGLLDFWRRLSSNSPSFQWKSHCQLASRKWQRLLRLL